MLNEATQSGLLMGVTLGSDFVCRAEVPMSRRLSHIAPIGMNQLFGRPDIEMTPADCHGDHQHAHNVIRPRCGAWRESETRGMNGKQSWRRVTEVEGPMPRWSRFLVGTSTYCLFAWGRQCNPPKVRLDGIRGAAKVCTAKNVPSGMDRTLLP